MTNPSDLTLEELQSVDDTAICSEELNDLGKSRTRAAVAMARRLLELESALAYLVRVEGPTVIADDGTDYDLTPEQLQEYATSLGWKGLA